jgi:paraquat-inducible protein B
MSLPHPGPDSPDARKQPGEALPTATVRKRRWAFSVVWVVPLVASLVAAYLVLGRFQEYGPMITIRFKDAGGVTVEQTNLEYRGVRIGQVKGIQLSADHQYVLAKVRLRRSAATIARDGSEFWIVRLRSGIESIADVGAAVGTVFSGPYIEILPGTGPPRTEFVGLDKPPAVQERGALHIVLHAGQVGSLRPGTPVLYRGVEVGAVQESQLNHAASAVDIRVTISPQYARLVRSNSRFSDVSGAKVHFGLLKGLQLDVQSLRSLIVGGIAFTTPENPQARPAKDGAEFQLNNGAAKDSSNDHRTHLLRRTSRS